MLPIESTYRHSDPHLPVLVVMVARLSFCLG